MVLTQGKFPYRKIAGAAAIILCVPLALHVALPLVIDLSWVRAQILTRASAAFSAEVDYKKITPALFPRPHAQLSQVQVVRGDKLRIQVPKAIVYFRFWPLLRGRFGVARLRMRQPEIQIQAPVGMPALGLESRPQSAQVALDRLRELLTRIAGGRGPVSVDLEKTRLAWSGPGPKNAGHLQFEDMDLNLDMQAPRQEEVKADFQVKAPVVRIQNSGNPVMLKDLALTSAVHWTSRELKIVLGRLRTSAPQLQLDGSATWTTTGGQTPAEPILVELNGSGINLGEIRTAGIQLAGDKAWVDNLFRILQGGQVPRLKASVGFSGGNGAGALDGFRMTCRLTDGRIAVPHDLLALEEVSGDIEISHGKLSAEHLTARSGNTHAVNGKLALGLWDGSRTFILDTDLDADLAELPPVLRKLAKGKEAADWMDRLPGLRGRATGRLSLGDRLDDLKAGINAKAHMEMLDATLDLEGSVKDLPAPDASGEMHIKGDLGLQSVQWLGEAGGVPVGWRPRQPISVTDAQLTRQPSGKWELSGDFHQAGEVQLHAVLEVDGDEIDLKQLHIKDPSSDASIVYHRQQALLQWDAAFSGILSSSTADRLLSENKILKGSLKGDLRVHIDMEAPKRSSFQGDLEIRQVDLPIGDLGTVSVPAASLAGRENGVSIASADLTWKEYSVQATGNATLKPGTVDLDLKLKTDALNVDKLIQSYKEIRSKPPSGLSQGFQALRVRGKMDVHAKQLDFGGYRFVSLQAVVALGDKQTTVEVSRADLCDVAVRGSLQISPDGLRMEFKPHAVESALKDTEACLSRAPITERLEGTVNADGLIETSGATARELVHNLRGNLTVAISDGRVYNVGAAGFFTNLLSFLSVNQLIKGGLPDLRKNDFRYKSLESKLTLKDGLLHIEEGVLKSNSVNIVASGAYKISTRDLDLVLLVSPLTTVDWIVERIPIVGDILQGTLVAIPVGVKGPIANPTVVPLSPTAVGSRLGGILERTIKTPFRILSPLLKDNSP